VLPQIEVAKVIFFPRFVPGAAEWLVGKNDLEPAFPFHLHQRAQPRIFVELTGKLHLYPHDLA